MNFKQAVGSENIYGVFNVFVKKSVSICAIRGRIKKIIRMANSSYPFNYFPLVSGSGGQDSLYSFNSCSKRIHHPHGKFVLFEILHSFNQWVYDYRCFSHCFCFIIGVVDNLQELFLHVVWLTNHSHRLTFKWCLWHQVHQLLLHAPMIEVLSCCLCDIATYLLALLLVVPYLDCFH